MILQQLGIGWPILSNEGNAIGRELIKDALRLNNDALAKLTLEYPPRLVALFVAAAAHGPNIYILRIPQKPDDFDNIEHVNSLSELLSHGKLHPNVVQLGQDLVKNDLAITYVGPAYKGAKWKAIFIHFPIEVAQELTNFVERRQSSVALPEELLNHYHLLRRSIMPSIHELNYGGLSEDKLKEYIRTALDQGAISKLAHDGPAFLIYNPGRYKELVLKPIFDKLIDTILNEQGIQKSSKDIPKSYAPEIEIGKRETVKHPAKTEQISEPSKAAPNAVVEPKSTTTYGSSTITFPPHADKEKIVFGRGELDGKLAWGYEVDKYPEISTLVTSDLTNMNEGHVGFFMQIRGGKSTLAASIILQAAFQKIPVVVIDPKPDYVSNMIPVSRGFNVAPAYKAGAIVRFDKVKQDKKGFDFWEKVKFEYKDESYELAFQIITFDEGRKSLPGVIQFRAPLLVLPSLEDKNFAEYCDSAATALSKNIFKNAVEKGYNTLLSKTIQRFKKDNPNVEYLLYSDLIKAIQESNDDVFGKRDINIVVRALKGAQTNTSSFFAGDPAEVTDIGNLITPKQSVTPLTIIDVSQLPFQGKEAAQQNFVSQVCGQIYHHVKSHRGRRAVELLLVLDEAQNYLPNPTDQYNYIRKLIQEGAGLGVKVVVIGQVPQDIEMSARQQLKTLVLSNVPEGTIRYVTDSFHLPNSWSDNLQKTGGGIALIINEKTAPLGGALCNTFTSPQMVGLLTPEQIKEAMVSPNQKL